MWTRSAAYAYGTQQHLKLSDMIALKDSIEISTTPEQLFDWIGKLPQVYTTWHPDHVSCRVLQGSMLEEGSEFECEEYLHGKLHSLRFRMTKVIPGKGVEFLIAGLGRGSFEAEKSGDGVKFIAKLTIGSDAPVIGRVFDWVFPLFFSKRIEAMRQHMVEEGRNLKAILESGSPLPTFQDAA